MIGNNTQWSVFDYDAKALVFLPQLFISLRYAHTNQRRDVGDVAFDRSNSAVVVPSSSSLFSHPFFHSERINNPVLNVKFLIGLDGCINRASYHAPVFWMHELRQTLSSTDEVLFLITGQTFTTITDKRCGPAKVVFASICHAREFI